MINIISQFSINTIHFGFYKCLPKKSMCHTTHYNYIVKAINVCMHHIRTHRLTHVQIQEKLVVANIKAKIHLGYSYVIREKRHGTKK
jgi:hypothetical protein